MEVENCCVQNCALEKYIAEKLIVEDDKFPKPVLQSIENVIRREGFVKYEVDKKQISTAGGNYLGTLYEVDIKGKDNKNINKELNIFYKYIIPDENNSVFSIKEAYCKEFYAYNELFKIFAELQDEAKVPLEDRFVVVKSYDDTNTEMIVMENFAKEGYATAHRKEVHTLKFAELSIQQLARFHGLSLLLKQKRSNYFDENIKPFKAHFKFSEEMAKCMDNLTYISTEHIGMKYKERLKGLLPNFAKKLRFYFEDSSMTGCCLCHGDYRSNNILMDDNINNVTRVVPLDFQLMYYGCPLNDFFYFIFCSSDQIFRKKYLHHLKDFYYESLKKFFCYFNEDVEKFYPRKEFEKQFKERLEFGLLVALYVSPFIFTSDDYVPDLGSDDSSSWKFVVDDECYKRVQGAVDDYIQWGYL